MVLGLLSFGAIANGQAFTGLDEATLRRYKEEAQNVAKGAQKNIEGVVGTDINHNQFKENIGYGGTNIEGAELGIEAAEDKGRMLRDVGSRGECTNKNCDVSSMSSTTAMLERDKNIEEAGFIKNEDGTVSDNKGYLDKPRAAVREAAGKFDFLTGSYADCTAADEITKKENYEVCDEYYDIKHDSCSINQVVEIDPRYNYACYKKREIKEKKCSDVITKLTCKQKTGCDIDDLKLSTVSNDVRLAAQNDGFIFSNKEGEYWCGHCAIFEREATFKIENKKLIKEFMLTEVIIDDHLQIKLNDQLVYNGQFGGDRLEVKQVSTQASGRGFWSAMFTTKVDTGNGHHGCEQHGPGRLAANINLLPYLQEGENKIKVRLIIGGCGYFGMKISAKQYCCAEWLEEREETCAYLD